MRRVAPADDRGQFDRVRCLDLVLVDHLGPVEHGHMDGLVQFRAHPRQQRMDQRPQIQRVVEPEGRRQQLSPEEVRSARLWLGHEPAVLEGGENPVQRAFGDAQPVGQIVQGEAPRGRAEGGEDPQRTVNTGHGRFGLRHTSSRDSVSRNPMPISGSPLTWRRRKGCGMRGLRGKRVLISGGSSGIGLAAAHRFLQEGASVFIAGLDPAEVAQAVAGLRASADAGGPASDVGGLACDVSQEADVAQLVEAAGAALGGVDVLANNAGIARRAAFLSMAVADWDRIIAVNLRGMFLVAQAVSAEMVRRGGGVIINMSSTNGMAGEEEYAHYNAAKAGVLLLTRTMAVELGRCGIRVNALCPGYISTPLNAAIAAGIGGDEFEQEYAR